MRNMLLAVSLVAVGCGGGVDQQSSVKVMNSALVGTSQAQVKLMPSGNATSASFNGQVTNTAGTGTATVNGSTVKSGASWATNFDIVFTNWSDLASGITISGTLHEDATLTTLSPYAGKVHLTGMVHATGNVTADIDFDVTVEYATGSIKMTGSVGGNTINVSVGG